MTISATNPKPERQSASCDASLRTHITALIVMRRIPARYRPWGASATYLIAHDDPNRMIDICKIDDLLALAEMEKLSVDQVVAAAEARYALGCAA
jgi:hypothetical protein